MATRYSATKYTKQTVDLICKNLQIGLTRNECFVGIVAEATFYKWLKKREEFREAVELAELQCKKRAVVIIQQSMPTNQQWAAWWLERKHHQEFGRRLEHSGSIKIEIVHKAILRVIEIIKHHIPDPAIRGKIADDLRGAV